MVVASYWVIVRRGRADLLDALSAAFEGRDAFAVIEDRRTHTPVLADDEERRGSAPPWDASDFLLAERVSLLE